MKKSQRQTMEFLVSGPRSTTEVAEHFGIKYSSARDRLIRLAHVGLVHERFGKWGIK